MGRKGKRLHVASRVLAAMDYTHDNDLVVVDPIDDPVATLKVEANALSILRMLLRDERRGGDSPESPHDLVIVSDSDGRCMLLQAALENGLKIPIGSPRDSNAQVHSVRVLRAPRLEFARACGH